MLVTTPPAHPGGRSSFRRLIDRNGNPTKSRTTYFYQKLQEQAPNRDFDPEQQPEKASRGRSETIKLRDGSRATVRIFNHLKGGGG